MNDLARERLREAALKGVRQIKGSYRDGDGRCALGAIDHEELLTTGKPLSTRRMDLFEEKFGLNGGIVWCPECSNGPYNEAGLILHLNDDHDMDFLSIANKL